MTTRSSLIVLSIALAVSSLALVISVVGGAASDMSSEAIAIEQKTSIREYADNRLLAYQKPTISQDEPLTLTEPISIYLPLVSTAGYIDKAVERAALIAIYNSTNGDEWINNTGWGTEATFCEWYGVACDQNGHVTILHLGANKLSGSLPSEIGNLPMLTVLRLTGTAYDCNKVCNWAQISGPLPPGIGNLANLLTLDLSFNRLTSLPAELGKLVNLDWLDLSRNQFTSIPPEIGNLLYLDKLDLTGNQLASLPPEIGILGGLDVLSLSENQLTALPAEIGDLVNLQVLHLSANQLTTLPPEIGNLLNLQELHLGVNQLTSIPSEVTNLASLQVLDLFLNQLIGPIPAYLSNLGSLYFLALDWNPDLTCWETQEARDWALSLEYYDGPTCYLP